MHYLLNSGFDYPIVVDDPNGLEMAVPTNFNALQLLDYIDGMQQVKAIDVMSQNIITIYLIDFVDYFLSPYRWHPINLLSVEMSQTSLRDAIQPPLISRILDWSEIAWPADCSEPKSDVQRYCLVSTKRSFTDFHVDFGGSSVWYHVVKGEKILYLIKPTAANIQLFIQWTNTSKHNNSFFGDHVDDCFMLILTEGQTLFLPTGWIHAVYTPEDSVVFGGNFLHDLNIPLQMEIYKMEKATHTRQMYLYPQFEELNWYAGQHILQVICNTNIVGAVPRKYLMQGIRALIPMLNLWLTKNEDGQPFTSIMCQNLIRDLKRELKIGELNTKMLTTPRPGRESKRQRKKTFNADFYYFPAANKVASKASVAKVPLGGSTSPNQSNVSSQKIPLSLCSLPIMSHDLQEKGSSDSSSNKTSHSSSPTLSKDMIHAPETIQQNELKMLCSQIPNQLEEAHALFSTERVDSATILTQMSHQVSESLNSQTITRQKMESTSSQSKQPHTAREESSSFWQASVLGNVPTLKVVLNRLANVPEPVTYPYSTNSVTTKKHHTAACTITSRESQDNNCQPWFVQAHTLCSKKELKMKVKAVSDSSKQTTPRDVYDFHASEDENSLLIDDQSSIESWHTNMQSKVNRKSPNSSVSSPTLSLGSSTQSDSIGLPYVKVNRIDELLKASALTGSGGTSPSTRDAIQGMLSISCSGSSSTSKMPIKTRSKKQHYEMVDDAQELVDEVHRDDDFVYPSLDVSDGEEPLNKRSKKRNIDEAWNPSARIGRLVPRTDRPTRYIKKNQAIEKGLEAAAAKRANLPPPKRPYNKKKTSDTPIPSTPGTLPKKEMPKEIKGIKCKHRQMGEKVTRGERKRKREGRKRQKSQGTPQGQQRSMLETLLPSRSRPFQLLGDEARMRVIFTMLVSLPNSS
uniref:JmjC domain-containing protein n=1 Tax=Timema douglasi TaxID=61478 RepID=A0A7R8VGG4_TIMDO|nr:unnamed protein product [Timema douglasi]